MSKAIYHLEVETVRKGQPRPYADAVNEAIITNGSDRDFSENFIKSFMEFLWRPRRYKDSPCWADSEETIEKIGDRKFRFMQVKPYTG